MGHPALPSRAAARERTRAVLSGGRRSREPLTGKQSIHAQVRAADGPPLRELRLLGDQATPWRRACPASLPAHAAAGWQSGADETAADGRGPTGPVPRVPHLTTGIRPVRSCSKWGVGGRHWTRTSDLLHVKQFRLSAVLRAWRAERNRVSYTVMPMAAPGDPPLASTEARPGRLRWWVAGPPLS